MHVGSMPGVFSGTTHCGTPVWLSETSNSSMGSTSWSSRSCLLHRLPTLWQPDNMIQGDMMGSAIFSNTEVLARLPDLTIQLEYSADFETQRCLRRSASSLSLNDHHMWLSTVSDRAFPVAAALTLNSLPQHVMSTSSTSCFPSSP